MNESKLAGLIILILLALMPIGFLIFRSDFIPFAPIIFVIGICIFGILSARKKRRHEIKMKKKSDDLREKQIEEIRRSRSQQ